MNKLFLSVKNKMFMSEARYFSGGDSPSGPLISGLETPHGGGAQSGDWKCWKQRVMAGILAATSDENSVMFTIGQQPAFEEIRDAIKKRIAELRTARAGGPAASAADEIAKFAKLKEEGLLTEEEFAAKKRQLLGI